MLPSHLWQGHLEIAFDSFFSFYCYFLCVMFVIVMCNRNYLEINHRINVQILKNWLFPDKVQQRIPILSHCIFILPFSFLEGVIECRCLFALSPNIIPRASCRSDKCFSSNSGKYCQYLVIRLSFLDYIDIYIDLCAISAAYIWLECCFHLTHKIGVTSLSYISEYFRMTRFQLAGFDAAYAAPNSATTRMIVDKLESLK